MWRWDRSSRLTAMQRRLSVMTHLIKIEKGKDRWRWGAVPDSGGEETVGEDPAHLPLHQAHLSPRQPSHRTEISPLQY